MSEVERKTGDDVQPLEVLPEKVTKTTGADIAAFSAKVGLSFVPLIGSAAAEIVTAIIPGQRLDRIQAFLEQVAEKVNHLEHKVIEEMMKTPNAVDFIEDCFNGAARATSVDRIGYLANLYVTGITSEQADHETNKKMASLLSQLSDAEVIWLGYLSQFRGIGEGIDKHRDVLYPRSTTVRSSNQERDAKAIQESWVSRLEQLGLVERKLKSVSRDALPLVDSFTGDFKRDNPKSTWLGRMLLGYIGIYERLRGGDSANPNAKQELG